MEETKSMTTLTRSIHEIATTTSQATATKGLRKILLFGRGIQGGAPEQAGRNQERDDRDTTVPLPPIGMSPGCFKKFTFLLQIQRFYTIFFIVQCMLKYHRHEIWIFLEMPSLQNILIAPSSLAVSSPPSSIPAWFQSCSVGLTGTSFWMVYMVSLQTIY